MAWSARRIVTTVLLTVLGLFVVGVTSVLITVASTSDPYGPRRCECPLLQEWAANLPLTSQGDHLDAHEVSIREIVNGFFIGGSGLDGVTVDRDGLLYALTAGRLFNRQIALDRPDRWVVAFYPGEERFQGEWDFEVTVTENAVGIQIRVSVDGSPWGLETIDDLYEFYRDDPEAAKAAQEERQRQAIEILEPVRAALETMVEEG